MKLAEVRKTVVAAVAGVASLLSAGLFHGTVLVVAEALIAAASAVGVYQTPNRS